MVKKRKKTKKAGRVKAAPAVGMESAPESILAAVRRIPRGKVCTYGNVAEVAGLPQRARLVGMVLRQTPSARDYLPSMCPRQDYRHIPMAEPAKLD
jgi:O6-methylguanine-DNA--protein-cysteine methyltransferase